MISKIDVETALNKKNKILIDVRSPKEFFEGTIQGAVNVPLLDDDERVEVGTIYKQQCPQKAKIRGLEHVSSKLPDISKKLLDLSKQQQDIIVFCSRGGLRSSSVVNLLNMLNVNAYQLVGGYKAYRNFILNYFENIEQHHQFIVLHGYTGVGKTEILSLLEAQNIPTLNLEYLAQNSGSVFGTINYSRASINQKMFETFITHRLLSLKSRYILTESESQRIGSVFIPKPLYSAMKTGKHIFINTSKENRISRLVNDYVNNQPQNDDLLIHSIENLKKWIGKEKIEKYIQSVHQKRYDKIAKELINNYYDPLYRDSIEKYHYDLHINYVKIEEAVKKIIQYYNELEGMTNQ